MILFGDERYRGTLHGHLNTIRNELWVSILYARCSDLGFTTFHNWVANTTSRTVHLCVCFACYKIILNYENKITDDARRSETICARLVIIILYYYGCRRIGTFARARGSGKTWSEDAREENFVKRFRNDVAITSERCALPCRRVVFQLSRLAYENSAQPPTRDKRPYA